jgi:hypothetical protein
MALAGSGYLLSERQTSLTNNYFEDIDAVEIKGLLWLSTGPGLEVRLPVPNDKVHISQNLLYALSARSSTQ